MKSKLNNPLWWLIGILATWRLTSIIHHEGIAQPIREAMGVDHRDSDDQEEWVYPKTFLGRLIECDWCTSVWAGFGIVLLLAVFPPLALALAFSAAYIWLKPRMEEE